MRQYFWFVPYSIQNKNFCCTPGITEQLYWPTDSECCSKFIIMYLFYYTPSLVLELGNTGILAALLIKLPNQGKVMIILSMADMQELHSQVCRDAHPGF